ncbi:hypothetical protein Tco_0067254 [Tanacetum coccineum]
MMNPPWERVAKPRITQSFSPETAMSFPPLGEEDGTEGPMIIEAKMGRHFMHRIYVELGGASRSYLYEHCFLKLHESENDQMVSGTTHLIVDSVEKPFGTRADSLASQNRDIHQSGKRKEDRHRKVISTDKSKITRKQSKDKQARTRESEEYKAEARKVKPQSNPVKEKPIIGQQKAFGRDLNLEENPKAFTLALLISKGAVAALIGTSCLARGEL